MILAQITKDFDSNTIMVKWYKQMTDEDGIVHRTPHRCAYSQSEKDKLLAECPEAADDVQKMGW